MPPPPTPRQVAGRAHEGAAAATDATKANLGAAADKARDAADRTGARAQEAAAAAREDAGAAAHEAKEAVSGRAQQVRCGDAGRARGGACRPQACARAKFWTRARAKAAAAAAASAGPPSKAKEGISETLQAAKDTASQEAERVRWPALAMALDGRPR